MRRRAVRCSNCPRVLQPVHFKPAPEPELCEPCRQAREELDAAGGEEIPKVDVLSDCTFQTDELIWLPAKKKAEPK